MTAHADPSLFGANARRGFGRHPRRTRSWPDPGYPAVWDKEPPEHIRDREAWQ